MGVYLLEINVDVLYSVIFTQSKIKKAFSINFKKLNEKSTQCSPASSDKGYHYTRTPYCDTQFTFSQSQTSRSAEPNTYFDNSNCHDVKGTSP